MKTINSSTSPASIKLPLNVAPASTKTSLHSSSSASDSSTDSRLTLDTDSPLFGAKRTAIGDDASTELFAPSSLYAMQRPGSVTILAVSLKRPRLSRTTRSGGLDNRSSFQTNCCAFSPSSACLRVIAGSSAKTVSIPVTMASHSARSRCTSLRASAPVIHLLSPFASAVRPSKLIASLHRTKGLRRSSLLKKPRFNRRAPSSKSCKKKTSTPAASNAAIPPPLTFGFGSLLAITTRLTPASISAELQGPVRPVWQQGSSVTKAVEPAARRIALAIATGSA